MGKNGKRGESFKPIRSYHRNFATQDCIKAMDLAKLNFIKTYMSFKKSNGCLLTEADRSEFLNFMSSVDGFYKSQMKQVRHNYLGDTEIKNVKQERQWAVMMATLRNAYKQGKEAKVTAVLYDMSQYSH